VKFVVGKDEQAFTVQDLFSPRILWTDIHLNPIHLPVEGNHRNHQFLQKRSGGSIHKIFVGGIMASLMREQIFEETGVDPVSGILDSPKKINLDGNENVDAMPPDYSILNPDLYAINDTYYAYTTRGCTRHCPWCGVPRIEPDYTRTLTSKRQ